MTPPRSPYFISAFALAVVWVALLVFTGLGNREIEETVESRRILIAQNMARSGDWVVPSLSGAPMATKPPLAYWLTAIPFVFRPETQSLFLIRLPLALTAFFALLFFGQFVRAFWGPSTGVLAMLALASTIAFRWGAQQVEPDPFLAFFSLISLGGYAIAVKAKREKKHRALVEIGALIWATAFACAFMSKGPLAVVIAVVPVAGAELIAPSLRTLKLRHWVLLVGLTAAIFGSWAWLLTHRLPGAGESLRTELLSRLGLGEEEIAPGAAAGLQKALSRHRESPTWYLSPSRGFFFPWSWALAASGLVLLISFAQGGKTQPRTLPAAESPDKELRKRRNLLAWLFILSPLLALSIVSSKRDYYAVAIAPGLTLASVLAIRSIFLGRLKRWRRDGSSSSSAESLDESVSYELQFEETGLFLVYILGAFGLLLIILLASGAELIQGSGARNLSGKHMPPPTSLIIAGISFLLFLLAGHSFRQGAAPCRKTEPSARPTSKFIPRTVRGLISTALGLAAGWFLFSSVVV
ncbi:MAG: phospholipid carrier-dependent glycosyltransferase, partial [bacterium]